MFQVKNGLHKSVLEAILAAIGVLLMFIEVPIIPFVSYLKLDFADVPVLLGTIIYGPLSGIIIAAIKCLLYALIHGMSPVNLLGVLASFCSSLLMLLPFAWANHHFAAVSRRALLWGSIWATILLAIGMTVFNYYVLTPAYMDMFNWHPSLPIKQLMLTGVLPFNLIKGVVVTLVTSLLAVHLRKQLTK